MPETTPGWVPAPHLMRARRARDRMRAAVGDLVQARAGIWLGSRDLNSVGDLFAGTRVLHDPNRLLHR